MEIIDALSIIDAKFKYSNDCNFEIAWCTIRKELAEALKPSHNIPVTEIVEIIKRVESRYYGKDMPSEVDDLLDELRQLRNR